VTDAVGGFVTSPGAAGQIRRWAEARAAVRRHGGTSCRAWRVAVRAVSRRRIRHARAAIHRNAVGRTGIGALLPLLAGSSGDDLLGSRPQRGDADCVGSVSGAVSQRNGVGVEPALDAVGEAVKKRVRPPCRSQLPTPRSAYVGPRVRGEFARWFGEVVQPSRRLVKERPVAAAVTTSGVRS